MNETGMGHNVKNSDIPIFEDSTWRGTSELHE